MELYQVSGPIEQKISIKADIAKIPLGGSLELTPICNMNCDMCYVKQSKDVVDQHGGLISLSEWLSIAQQAKDMGTLFLLLTGGEPLLYPDFYELYTQLHRMGFILQVNTNGTLINDRVIDLFDQYRPRQLNITLYGASDETYAKLCHNPIGFTQVSKAIKKLKERNIPFRVTCSLTPHNVHDVEKIVEFVKINNLEFSPNEYMFPPIRKENTENNFIRFTPQECARIRIHTRLLMNPEADKIEQAKLLLRTVENTQPLPEHRRGFQCRAGKSGFWINWKGELLACGMMNTPAFSLKEYSFDKAWKQIVSICQQMHLNSKCISCQKRSICNVCIASCYAESNGDFNKTPEYLCDMADEMINIAKKWTDMEDE